MTSDASRRSSTDPLPLTGERTVPGVASENYWFRRHEAAYRFAGARTGERTLDVGCGEGYGSAILARTRPVTAMELDAASAAHAATRYGPRIRVLRADACRLPLRPGSFRSIVAMQVLEHLWCADRFVEQAREALEPGGTLVLSTPNRETFSPDGVVNPFHTHEYTSGELRDLLARSFADVEVLAVRPGIFLRSLDVLASGSLQHLLMDTPYEELPTKLRTGVGLVRADHFSLGEPEGSLDLLAVATA